MQGEEEAQSESGQEGGQEMFVESLGEHGVWPNVNRMAQAL
jgi:hypothetical protein